MRSTKRASGRSRHNPPENDDGQNHVGWPLERCPDELIAARCEALRIEAAANTARGAKGCAKRRELLAGALASEALIVRVLRQTSAFELVLLESLVDLGGVAGADELWDEACRRAWLERPFDGRELERAIGLLGCRLTERSPFGGERSLAALLEPCCTTLRRMLSGITLPPRSSGNTGPSPLPAEALRAQQRLRDHLLVATRCAHVRVKRTKSGAPSRTQLRKFEGDISTSGDSLWAMLEATVGLGLTGGSERSDNFCPDLARLREAAGRGFVAPTSQPTLRAAASWAATEPIPVEYLVRHYQQVAESRGAAIRLDHRLVDRPATAQDISNLVDSAIGLWFGKLDDVLVVARPSPQDANADGHVLPNFDVILGPNTSHRVAVVVGCAAELVRLDHLASLRLTPESVRAATAAGLEVSEILDALDHVGARKTPEGVRRCVEEWAAGTRLARIVRDRVLVLPTETAAGLAEDTGGRRWFELLAPGVLRVLPWVTEAKLANKLDDAGVSVRSTPTDADSEADQGPEPQSQAPASAGPDPLPWGDDTLDPDARARVHEALAQRKFPLLPATLHQRPGPGSGAPASAASSAPASSGSASVDALVRRLQEGAMPDAMIEREMFDAVAALERWHRKLRVKARTKISLPDLLQPEGLAGLLALVAPEARAPILNRCTNPSQIRRRASTAIAQGHVSRLAHDAGDDDDDDDPPEVDEFDSLPPREVRQVLERAADANTPVWLLIHRGGTKHVTQRLLIETIEPRGRDVMVLARADDGYDDDSSDCFALPLTSIASVLLEDGLAHGVGGMDLDMLEEMLAGLERRRRR